MRHIVAPLVLASTVFALLGVDATAPSMSGTAAPAAVPASSLIHVSTCSANSNVKQANSALSGYGNSYYGSATNNNWADVYGGMYYAPPITTVNPELGIDFKNISSKTMTTIEFGLITNGMLLAEVRDTGSFTTGAEIKHKYGLKNSVFPIVTPVRCVPLRITFADGTKWRNPKLPPKDQKVYKP